MFTSKYMILPLLIYLFLLFIWIIFIANRSGVFHMDQPSYISRWMRFHISKSVTVDNSSAAKLQPTASPSSSKLIYKNDVGAEASSLFMFRILYIPYISAELHSYHARLITHSRPSHYNILSLSWGLCRIKQG